MEALCILGNYTHYFVSWVTEPHLCFILFINILPLSMFLNVSVLTVFIIHVKEKVSLVSFWAMAVLNTRQQYSPREGLGMCKVAFVGHKDGAVHWPSVGRSQGR